VTVTLDAPAPPINPHEQAVLDYLAEHPGAGIVDAVRAHPPIGDNDDRAVALLARLLWKRRLPGLIESIGADRVWFGLPEAVDAAHLLLTDTTERPAL
jgi:hypothetical protein